MGRKKIQISRITDERNRQVTFNKRKFGVMKKAYELSVLCDCEIALIIFSSSNKLYQYASTDMDKVLLKYTEYNEPHESLTNKNIIEALNKKEHKNGGCSPESAEENTEYQLTPRTEAKYSKIDEAFQMMMQKNQLTTNNRLDGNNYNLSISVPIGGYNDSSLLQSSPHMGHNSVSPRPSSSEAESDVSVFTGNSMLEMSNGYPNSTSPDALVASPSSDHSPITQNLHIKSSDHTKPSSTTSGTRPNLRVVIPNPHDENNISNTSLNTPVISLQTPTLSSYPSLYDINSAGDLSLTSALSWPSVIQTHSSGLTHLGVPNSSPVPSPSPNSVHVKSEPNSPPRSSSDHHPLVHMLAHTHAHSTHPSLTAQHLLQGNSGSLQSGTTMISTTGDLRHEYDSGPASKRSRDGWGP